MVSFAHSHCNLIRADCDCALNMGAFHRAATLILLLFLVANLPQDADARRGKGMKRTKSRTAMTLNTGKFLDKDSHNYYNHKDGAKIISASHFDLEFTLGHKIKFVCTATGNPLPSITWFKDGIEIFAHAYTTVHEHVIEKNKTHNDTRIISKLEIDPAAQMDAGIYECSADNKYSIDRRSFKTDFSIIFD